MGQGKTPCRPATSIARNRRPRTISPSSAPFRSCGSLRPDCNRSPVVACDLEADSMYHFKEKVCLLQLAADGRSYVVDALALGRMDPLQPIVRRPGHPQGVPRRRLRCALPVPGFRHRDPKSVRHGTGLPVSGDAIHGIGAGPQQNFRRPAGQTVSEAGLVPKATARRTCCDMPLRTPCFWWTWRNS